MTLAVALIRPLVGHWVRSSFNGFHAFDTYDLTILVKIDGALFAASRGTDTFTLSPYLQGLKSSPRSLAKLPLVHVRRLCTVRNTEQSILTVCVGSKNTQHDKLGRRRFCGSRVTL